VKILVVFGTRPEAIKMAPVVRALRARGSIDVEVCVTGQHRSMLDQVLDFFDVRPDYDLNIMATAQGLTNITCALLKEIEPLLQRVRPDRVLVHGDTTTAMATSLACYYQQIPVGHVEAGLRSYDPLQPWPEEINRRIVDVVADMLFAPTQVAKANLVAERADPGRIYVTGNTVIDALLTTVELAEQDSAQQLGFSQEFPFIDESLPILLVTGHRRENFGEAFEDLCHAIKDLAETGKLQVIYPVHLNPEVRRPVLSILGKTDRVHLVEPANYLRFVQLVIRSKVILTDSGGIQEEAPSLGKPVFVMRNVTERPEAVDAGVVRLVGTNRRRIFEEVYAAFTNTDFYESMSRPQNPYGDGKAADRIAAILCGEEVAEWQPNR
jgi:UDP-N-acetylglucosamine 2-epimerase